MITLGGTEPGGWIYVAWHPLGIRHTKIGYSKWHPKLACWKYPHGIKRIHRLQFAIQAFGLGELESWESEFHPQAKLIEKRIHKSLKPRQRLNVGSSREIFDMDPDEAIEIVREHLADA